MPTFYTRLLPLLGGLSSLASLAHAQTTFAIGPRVGLTLAGASYKGSANDLPGGTSSVAYKAGGEAGLMASVSQGHFALQPALLFTQHRYRIADDHQEFHGPILHYTSQTDYRFDYLTLPINVAYQAKADGQGAQVFAGGYVGMLLGGHTSGSGTVVVDNLPGAPYTTDADIKPGNKFMQNSNDFYSKRFDAGVQAGVGYRYNRFLVQATYRIGLVNVEAANPYSMNNPTCYNRSVQASLVYLFEKL